MLKAGATIRLVRDFRKMKREELARAIGVSLSKLYRLEKDDPRIPIADYANAAAYLKLKFDWKTGYVSLPDDMGPESVKPLLAAQKTLRKLRSRRSKRFKFLTGELDR